jgi:hypothetical protein
MAAARLKVGRGAAGLATMTSKRTSKRLWRSIGRYVRSQDRRVRVRQLARRFKLAPSNVSRGLRRRGIFLEPRVFPWEAGSKPRRQEQVRRCRQALALYFLGLTRGQIERLLPIKSETVRSYVLALTTVVSHPGAPPYRMFLPDARASLAQELERAYGLGDPVEDVIHCLEIAQCPAGAGNGSTICTFPIEEREFLRGFHRSGPLPAFLVRKLRQILRAKVRHLGKCLYLPGRNGGEVKVRVPQWYPAQSSRQSH